MNILCLKKISRTPAVSRSIDIPSIPSAGKSHGYHLNDDDSIRKRTPPASDDTIGPAYYKPQFVSSKRLMRTLGRLLLLYISFMRQQLLSDNQNTDFFSGHVLQSFSSYMCAASGWQKRKEKMDESFLG